MVIKKTAYFLLFIFILLLDQITKYSVLWYLDTPYLVSPYLTFDIMINRGISWGLFNNYGNFAFYSITFMIICIILSLILYTKQRLSQANRAPIFGEILVIAGSVSNLIDRLYIHGVIDFIALSYGKFTFPVFNIADITICFGVTIMLLQFFSESKS